MELNYDNREQYTRITEDGELIIDDVITEINSNTFADENKRSVIDIREGIAFYRYSYSYERNKEIKKIKIPEGITSLNSNLFCEFENLEEVILPESLETIKGFVFQKCINLKKINIPSNVEKIGDCAFENCKMLEDIELPEKINHIGLGVFRNCESLEKIVIPENVQGIGHLAFWGCNNLKEVVLPEKIESLGKETFGKCINLEKINFPDSLIQENNSFDGCNKNIIKSIPSRLVCDKNGILNKFYPQFIVDNTFIIPKGVKRIEKLDGWANSVAHLQNRRYRESDEEYEEKIKNIKIEEIEIPDTVLAIGDKVIEDFRFLKKVSMPDSIIELGKNNFGGCNNLEKVRLSRNLKSITKDVVDNLRNSNIQCLIIPDSVQEIEGGHSFKDDRYYDEIRGEFNTDTIIYYSKKDIARIYDSSKNAASQQISVTENKTVKYYSIFGERQDVLVEKNENTNKQITMSDVKDLDKIKKIVISSDNIKKIGPFAFSQCPNLEEVYIKEGITEIGPGAFAECENLKKVHFPKSLRKISDYAFFDCDKLEEVKINSKSVTLGDFCFQDCDTLQYAEFPERVEKVGKSAFSYCKDLKFVGGMKDVDKIDDYAFCECDQLKISIPHKIKEIGNCAYMRSGIKNWSFKDLDDNELVDYPFNETIIIMPASLEKLGISAFEGCKGITQLHFNHDSKLKEIPRGAFFDCNLMSFIEFPNEMVKIDYLAFAKCERLEEIYLPEKVEEIGKQSFYGCKSLKLAMFKGDRKGQELSKPDAFDGCDNLEILNFSDLELNTEKINGEIFDVARKEKTKKTFSVKSLKESVVNRKEKKKDKEI